MLQYSLELATQPTNEFDSVLSLVEDNSDKWAKATSKKESKMRGQVFTPLAMSSQLSALIPSESLSTGDHKLTSSPT